MTNLNSLEDIFNKFGDWIIHAKYFFFCLVSCSETSSAVAFDKEWGHNIRSNLITETKAKKQAMK
jgi:hypothetical protein